MTVRPAIKWLALGTGVLPLLIILLLAFVLFSETAAKSIWSLASGAVPGLSATAVSGRLAGPLHIRGLHFSNDALSIDAADIALDWQLEKLVFGELYLGTLRANRVRIHSYAEQTAKQDEPFALPARLPLPVIVRLADAKINDVQIRTGEATPFLVNSVQLRGQAGSGEVFVEQLNIGGPLLELTAQLSTQLWNNYKTDASVAWRYAIPDLADTHGTLKANGDLDGLKVALRGHADNTLYGDYELTLNGLASTQSLTVSETLLRAKNSDTFLSARGTVGLQTDTPEIDAQLEWHKLRWPLQGDEVALLSSQNGNIELRGTLGSYTATLTGELSTPQVRNGQIRLDATGGVEHLHISSLSLRALRGSANGQARINWAAPLSSSFQLSGAGLDPGELLPQWPGAIDFEVRGKQAGSKLSISRLEAKGIIREQEVALQASASYDGIKTTVPELRLRSGRTRLDASGLIGENMDFKWDFDSPDLSTLLPGAGGQLASAGRLTGNVSNAKNDVVLNATIRARNLHYNVYKIGSMDGKASIDLGSTAASQIDLDAKSLSIAGNQIQSLLLDGSGQPGEHSLRIQASADAANVNVKVQGGWQDQRWLGQLLSADISPAALDAWTLRDAAELKVSALEQSISQACWEAGASAVCLQVDRAIRVLKTGVHIPGTEAQLSVSDFSLDYLQSLLPPGIELDGVVSANGEFRQASDQQWATTALIDSSSIKLTAVDADAEQRIELLASEPGSLNVEVGSLGGQLSVRLPFVGGGGIDGDIKVVDNSNGLNAAKLEGGVALDVPALDVVAAFVPELKTLQGKLNATIAVSGTVEKPEPTTELMLTQGLAELATPGLLISDIMIKANTKPSGQLLYMGNARSEGGALALQGASVLGGDAPKTELTVKGQDFQVWNTAEARVWASPDLSVNIHGNQVTVRGKVALPKARITPQELPSGAVDVSSDQIIISPNDERTAGVEQALQVAANVAIEMGDDVTVQGFGFKGAVAGDLNVRQQPGKPLVGSGELNIVNGEYRAYGQGLVIDRGQILFAGGAIDNPGLSVRALRRPAEDIVVGVNVRGELRQPELDLFSEPGMSQSDQLSWLVLGRPLQSASGAESDYITQAALALGIRGGNAITKGIGDSLGVDTFAIQTGSGEAGAASDVNQAALVIGKYLTPKLYVSYGVGLLEAVNTVKLRYLMTDRWNLETESSAISSGGDISYSFEK